MLVLSDAVVLELASAALTNTPIIGYRNVVTTDNLVADYEDTDFPAVNLCNDNTSLVWKSTSLATQYITITPSNYIGELDYIGIANHNFGTAQCVVSIEAKVSEDDPWTEIFEEHLFADDSPIQMRFTKSQYFDTRIKLQPSAVLPFAAVVYLGELTTMTTGLYAGHVPLKYARKTTTVSSRAETGAFIGRIKTGEYRESDAHFYHIDPDFYRSDVDPFVVHAQEHPFFFAWRPEEYPEESGFAVMINDPMPTPDSTSHLIEVTFQLRGIA